MSRFCKFACSLSVPRFCKSACCSSELLDNAGLGDLERPRVELETSKLPMRLSISDNALLRSKSESSMLNWSVWLGWLLSVARWAKPTISSRWSKPTDECGCCCVLLVSVARWTEPTAVELPAVTADNLSKVGTWWFRMVLVSSNVPPPNGV